MTLLDLIGRALAGRRERAALATEAGLVVRPNGLSAPLEESWRLTGSRYRARYFLAIGEMLFRHTSPDDSVVFFATVRYLPRSSRWMAL